MAITVRNEDTIKTLESLVDEGYGTTKTKLIDEMVRNYKDTMEIKNRFDKLIGALTDKHIADSIIFEILDKTNKCE